MTPPSPTNPVLPLSSAGTVPGLAISFATFSGGSFDLAGAITAPETPGFDITTGSPETDLTIEDGASFNA